MPLNYLFYNRTCSKRHTLLRAERLLVSFQLLGMIVDRDLKRIFRVGETRRGEDGYKNKEAIPDGCER